MPGIDIPYRVRISEAKSTSRPLTLKRLFALVLRNHVRLDLAKNRSPHRVSRFRKLELKRGVGVQCFSEFVLARLFTGRSAGDERQILVCAALVPPCLESQVQRRLKLPARRFVGAFLVALGAPLEHRFA